MYVIHRFRLFPALILSVAAAAAVMYSNPRQAFLDRLLCVLPQSKAKTAGLVLENVEASHPSSDAEIWEKVIRTRDAGEMPPYGMPRPDTPALNGFTASLGTDLDSAARKTPYAGRPSSVA